MTEQDEREADFAFWRRRLIPMEKEGEQLNRVAMRQIAAEIQGIQNSIARNHAVRVRERYVADARRTVCLTGTPLHTRSPSTALPSRPDCPLSIAQTSRTPLSRRSEARRRRVNMKLTMNSLCSLHNADYKDADTQTIPKTVHTSCKAQRAQLVNRVPSPALPLPISKIEPSTARRSVNCELVFEYRGRTSAAPPPNCNSAYTLDTGDTPSASSSDRSRLGSAARDPGCVRANTEALEAAEPLTSKMRASTGEFGSHFWIRFGVIDTEGPQLRAKLPR